MTREIAPVAFHSVSEHEDLEAPRPPVRRRHRHDAEVSAPPTPLQLVETQVEAPMPVVEDELPRRTKPRRRRAAPAGNDPVMLVETRDGVDHAAQGENPPTP